MSRKLHTKTFRTLIATLFLGLFLFANYGVNATGLHQHEHHSSNEDEKSHNAHTDCYICDFQGLSYEPLTQKIDFITQNTFEDYPPIVVYFVSHFISEQITAIQQRGPPTMEA